MSSVLIALHLLFAFVVPQHILSRVARVSGISLHLFTYGLFVTPLGNFTMEFHSFCLSFALCSFLYFCFYFAYHSIHHIRNLLSINFHEILTIYILEIFSAFRTRIILKLPKIQLNFFCNF